VSETKSIYGQLANIDVSEHVKKKGAYDYLSWTHAVDFLKKEYPKAQIEVMTSDEGHPFFKTEVGFFVQVKVTVDGLACAEWLPVLDNRNKVLKQPDAYQVNTSIKRCMTKAIALHGLGINVYAGEDLRQYDVEDPEDPEDPPSTTNGKSKSKPAKKSSTDKKKVEAETKTNGSQGLTKDEILDALRGAVGEDVLNDKQAVFNVADKLFNEGKKGFNASKLTALPVDKLNLVLDEIKKQIEELN
jgi:hypothetical protein